MDTARTREDVTGEKQNGLSIAMNLLSGWSAWAWYDASFHLHQQKVGDRGEAAFRWFAFPASARSDHEPEGE
jgi:hypothetical protein